MRPGLGPSEAGPSPASLSAARRLVGLTAMAIVAIMIATTLLIVSPTGTPMRSQARAAALPYFSQSWRVFAPNILKTDRSLQMRAQWREDGRLVESAWISITAIEQRAVTGRLAGSRVAKNSWNASGAYLQRYLALDDRQQARVRGDFTERDDERFRAIDDAELIAQLGRDDPHVIRFLRMDYMLMRYTTMYAMAGFGRPIERVQWRVVRERPNDFANRFSREQQFADRLTTFGWRQSRVRRSAGVVAAYRDLLERHGALWMFRRAA